MIVSWWRRRRIKKLLGQVTRWSSYLHRLDVEMNTRSKHCDFERALSFTIYRGNLIKAIQANRKEIAEIKRKMGG